MKNRIYIFIVLILFSCNNRNDSPNAKEASHFEEADLEIEKVSIESEKDKDTDDLMLDIEEFNFATESFQYEELSQLKLQEMYDLLSLQKSKPEFSESIELQLKDYTDTIKQSLIAEEVIIQNLELKEDLIQVSDSTQKMKLHFDIVSKNSIKKDSIWAIITTKIILFEGEKIKSNKIRFDLF
ncbi:MAG: hypothetical protein EVB11_03755 [Winogradskyella sp.]|nr:MAG: hypothetical protein EVB11_03755 [Winogradskyella sp.]